MPEPDQKKNTNTPANISFKPNPAQQTDDALISFITAETGKMKSLATADVNSYIELANEFMNIGKPFRIEGVGTLLKTKEGIQFYPEHIQYERNSKPGIREIASTSSNEDSFTGYDDVERQRREPSILPARMVVMLLMLAGSAFAVWGGYTLYKKNNPDLTQFAVPVANIAQQAVAIDSSTIKPPKPEGYKFILEVAKPRRAKERFAKLKSLRWKVQMETKDSSQFTLFMVLPVQASDTTRVRDSLTALSGRRVWLDRESQLLP